MKLVLLRHGESKWNLENKFTGWKDVALTEKGEKEVKATAKSLKDKHIDYIVYSPLQRTKETAQLIADELGVPKEKLIHEERLREVTFGVYEQKKASAYRSFFSDARDRFTSAPEKAEDWSAVKRRVSELLYELDAT